MNAFRAAVESRDLAAMEAALHPEVVFRSPAVFKPYEGREATMFLLSTVIEVFEDFEYVDELEGESTHALVFRARVGERSVDGLDHLTLDEQGLVTQLVVMIRPLSGLTALAEAMAERLGQAPRAAT
jgi:hypothetical protein